MLFLPANLRAKGGGKDCLHICGQTVQEVLQNAEKQYPELVKELLFHGEIRPGLTIAINDTIMDDPLPTPLDPASEIYIVPAMAGG